MAEPAYVKYVDSGLLMSARFVDYDVQKPVYGKSGALIGTGYRAHEFPVTVLTEFGFSYYPDGEYVDLINGTQKKYKTDYHLVLSVFSDYFSSKTWMRDTPANMVPRDLFCVGTRFFTNLTHKAESYSGLEFVLRGRIPLLDRRGPAGLIIDMAIGKMFYGENSGSLSVGFEFSGPIFVPSK